ncbi:hypothetical protein ACVINI_004514 [Rhizobium beringeri]|jgi:hypothetical protein
MLGLVRIPVGLPCPDQLTDGADLHLAHDIGTAQLDHDVADAEVEGGLIVEASARHHLA